MFYIHDGTDFRFTILPTSGNVGIGTTNPGAKLEVYDTGADTYIKIHEDAGTHDAGIHLRTGGAD
jgi:hypothetical protein